MAETSIAELFAQGGLGVVVAVILLLVGREMVAATKANTVEVKTQGENAASRDAASELRAAERHTVVVEKLGEVREAIAKARRDDDFEEHTPVQHIRSRTPNGVKR